MRTLKAIVTATGVITSVVISGCDGASSPTAPSTSAAITANPNSAPASLSASSSRSGALHLTKECSAYTGLAGSFCTIASSNLKWIKVGSRIIYSEAAVGTSLDSDVILNPPGRSKSTAFGHCVADFVTGQGLCTFSGGTGKFGRFQASVAVSQLDGVNFALDGTYSFGRKGGKGDDDDDERGERRRDSEGEDR